MNLRSDRSNGTNADRRKLDLVFDQEQIGLKTVSPLKFTLLDQPTIEVSAVANATLEAIEGKAQLKSEIALLKERLRLQEQQETMRIEDARTEASLQACAKWEPKLKQQIEIERESITRSLDQFSQERSRYFAGVEAEVVKLALAIAARVLHREVNLDPLMLTAVVKVALGKITDESTTIVQVPAREVELWRAFFADSSPQSSVEVVGDEHLKTGDCVLKTNMGRVDLGVDAQISEIETGFFDLLQQRPA